MTSPAVPDPAAAGASPFPPGRPVRVGIIGLSASGGWAARAHLPALRALRGYRQGYELRALAASSAERAAAAAQAYDVPLTAGQTAQLLFLMFITSKGIANVPRASLLVVAAILPYFGIPQAGVVLVLAVDSFVDMGRTCTNTVATAIAAVSVAKWDGSLGRPDEDLENALDR